MLWWLDDPASLQTPSRRLIADPRTRVSVSAAVDWEITIKRQLALHHCRASFMFRSDRTDS